MRRCLIVTAIAVAVRVAALPLPGTLDVMVWKIWAFAGATQPVTSLYGVGGDPPERAVHEYDGEYTTVDYPPGMLHVLGLAGKAYRLFSPEFANTPVLNVAIKLPVVLADLALCFVLLAVLRRHGRRTQAMWTFEACALNPAIVVNGAVLGYLDPVSALPACGAVLAAATGSPFVAGSLLGLAVMLKAQAVFVTPAVVVVIAASRAKWTALGRATLGAALVLGLFLAPFVIAGALPNLRQGLGGLARHDMLSGNAANLWWIVTYVMRAAYAVADLGAWRAWTMPTRILAISTVQELGYPDARLIGIVMTSLVAAWGLWRLCRDPGMYGAAWMAAFTAHTYFVLSAQVHENHLYLAVPMLAVAAAGIDALRPLFYAVSIFAALNLNMFYGFGRDVGFAIPRTATVIDATVLLAVAGVALLAWHVSLIRRFSGLDRAGSEKPAPQV